MNPFFPVLSTVFALSFFILAPLRTFSQEASNDLSTHEKQAKNPSSPSPLGLSTLEWRENADQGDFASMMELSRFWLSRLNREKQITAQSQEAYSWANHWLKKAAETAHPAPQFYLTKLKYTHWSQEPSDQSSSLNDLRDSADSCEIRTSHDDFEAILVLMDYFGKPDQQQFEHWIAPFRKKTTWGDSQAQADLARLLFLFPQFQSNSKESLNLAIKSAKRGNIDGMYMSGKIVFSMDAADEQMREKALSMLIYAGRSGHIKALESLFSQLESGKITENDISKCSLNFPCTQKEIIQRLCDKGQLDFLLSRGKELVEHNIDAPGGLSMLVRAADQGSFTALDLLSKYYQNNGYNVPESPEKCIAYASRLAANNGVNGLLKMASYYERGFGVEKNEKTAFEYTRQAMSLGIPEACVEYARLLIKGIGTSPKPNEAFTLLTQTEKKAPNTPSLHFLLGYMYEEGIGTNKDLNQALIYYSKGAENGDSRAMNNLASMHELGSGTPKNIQKAAELYLEAAKYGNSDAKRNIKKMNPLLKQLSTEI